MGENERLQFFEDQAIRTVWDTVEEEWYFSIVFAALTDEVTKAWSGMNTREYKNLKGLKKESLRDNMSTTELVLNMLAETATKDISASTTEWFRRKPLSSKKRRQNCRKCQT